MKTNILFQHQIIFYSEQLLDIENFILKPKNHYIFEKARLELFQILQIYCYVNRIKKKLYNTIYQTAYIRTKMNDSFLILINYIFASRLFYFNFLIKKNWIR